MLRFQAKCGAFSVSDPALAMNRAVEKIRSVKLNAGLGCPNFQNAASSGIFDSRSEGKSGRPFLVQHKIVVVAFSELELIVIGVNTRADFRGLAKIEGSSFYVLQFAGGNET